MKEKLKNCPFCGEKVSMYWWDDEEQNSKKWEECDDDIRPTFPVIECRNCDYSIIFDGQGYGKEVIESWNKRFNLEEG